MADEAGTKKLLADTFIILSRSKTIDKITVRDIVEKCGLTKTTFYNHFRDKYDLMVWAYAEPLKNLLTLNDGEDYCLVKLIEKVLNYCAANRQFFINAIENTSGQNYFLHQVAQIHFSIVKECATLVSPDRKLSTKIETLMKLYTFGTVQLLCEWLLKKMPLPVEEFAEYLAAGVPEELEPYMLGEFNCGRQVDHLAKS